MSETTSSIKRKNRSMLIGVFALFFVPVIVAYLALWTGWRPTGTTNKGELLQPPVKVDPADWRVVHQMDEALFLGDWSVVLAWPDTCAADCLEALDQANRARIALNNRMTRVELVLLGQDDDALLDPMTFTQLAAKDGVVAAWLGETGQPAVFVVDPDGWRILRYGLPLDMEGLHDDLKRLLKNSDEKFEKLRLEDAG